MIFWISISIYLYLYGPSMLNIGTLRWTYFLDQPRGLVSPFKEPFKGNLGLSQEPP